MITLILATTLLASPGEIVLSECSRFPQFDTSMVRYENRGPSEYGVWFYDLVYRSERTVLLTDAWGHVECQDPVKRSEIKTLRFSLSEQFGRRENVAADVRAWLAGREVERCP